jgi:hypothetical protein
MFILPPYQEKGHRRCLLTTIYNDLRKDSHVQHIAVIMKCFQFEMNYVFFCSFSVQSIE